MKFRIGDEVRVSDIQSPLFGSKGGVIRIIENYTVEGDLIYVYLNPRILQGVPTASKRNNLFSHRLSLIKSAEPIDLGEYSREW